jgi:putative hydrolase of the HAD superfamily
LIPLPKAILFDLDDTILSFEGRQALLITVADECREELSPFQPEEVGRAVELAFSEFWAQPGSYAKWRNRVLEARTGIVLRLFEKWSIQPDVAPRFAERFHDLRENGECRLFPGALETIRELGRRGVKLALVTNGHADTQREKVERFGLAPLFDHVQIEGELGFGKPDPRAYLHAMQALGVQPAETWMVGDHLHWEVEAPQKLGIYAIWHDFSRKGLPPNSPIHPDRIIHRINEILME